MRIDYVMTATKNGKLIKLPEERDFTKRLIFPTKFDAENERAFRQDQFPEAEWGVQEVKRDNAEYTANELRSFSNGQLRAILAGLREHFQIKTQIPTNITSIAIKNQVVSEIRELSQRKSN